MSSFTVGPDRVLPGWWAVRDHNGTVARRLTRYGQQRKACPAVFRTEGEANDFCDRINLHFGGDVVTEARWEILRTVNKNMVRRSQRRTPFIPPRLLGMRHIQTAVCIARRRELVDADLLRAAGFATDAR